MTFCLQMSHIWRCLFFAYTCRTYSPSLLLYNFSKPVFIILLLPHHKKHIFSPLQLHFHLVSDHLPTSVFLSRCWYQECTKKRMISGTFPSLPYVCYYDTMKNILQRRTRVQERAKGDKAYLLYIECAANIYVHITHNPHNQTYVLVWLYWFVWMRDLMVSDRKTLHI